MAAKKNQFYEFTNILHLKGGIFMVPVLVGGVMAAVLLFTPASADAQTGNATQNSSQCESLSARLAGSAVLVGTLAITLAEKRLGPAGIAMRDAIAGEIGAAVGPAACVFLASKLAPFLKEHKVPSLDLREFGSNLPYSLKDDNLLVVPVSPGLGQLSSSPAPGSLTFALRTPAAPLGSGLDSGAFSKFMEGNEHRDQLQALVTKRLSEFPASQSVLGETILDPRKASLGATIEDTAAGLHLFNRTRVKEVELFGPASAAGIQTGDEITAIDQQPISGKQDLESRIAAMSPGTSVQLRVVRDGWEKTLTVKLGTAPPAGTLPSKPLDLRTFNFDFVCPSGQHYDLALKRCTP